MRIITDDEILEDINEYKGLEIKKPSIAIYIAKKHNVSKQAIYKRLRRLKLNKHIRVKNDNTPALSRESLVSLLMDFGTIKAVSIELGLSYGVTYGLYSRKNIDVKEVNKS